MTRAHLIPVVGIDDQSTVSKETVRVPDFLGSTYVDRIKDLEVDRKVVLDAKYEGYPDLLSYKFYDTVDYWWILCMYNGSIDPLDDMKAGQVWSIPTLGSIQSMLANRTGSRANRIGTVVVI